MAASPAVQVLVAGKLELSEEHWKRISGLLPAQKPPRGRPGNDQQTLLAGMLWVMETGAGWRELPARFGAWQTLYSCYQRWRKSGIWKQILDALQQGEPDA
ncbi:MAG: transposase [Chloroflexia bacterium]